MYVMVMVAKSSFQCFHLEENFPCSTNVIEYIHLLYWDYFSHLCWVMISVISMITLVMCTEISSVCFLMYLKHQNDGYILNILNIKLLKSHVLTETYCFLGLINT